MTVRSRLIFAAVTLLLVLVGGGLTLLHSERLSTVTATDRQLLAAVPIAERVAAQSASGGSQLGGAAPLSSVYVAKRAADGTITVLLRPSTVTDAAPASIPSAVAGKPVSPVTSRSTSGSWSWRVVALPSSGTATLVVAAPFDPNIDPARTTETLLLAARVLLVIAVAATGWWLIRVAMRPIGEVTRVANAISSGDRSQRVAEGRVGSEANKLATAFNDMLDSQHDSEDRLRQFVADASHELRTPVTAIAGFADLYRRGGVEPAQLDDVMRRIGQETSRMRDLVQDMLLLARLDEGRALTTTDVDLSALARDAVLDASATHPTRTVVLRGATRTVVAGDEAQLRQIFANLLTNALIHTSGSVTIDIRTMNDRVTVDVSDTGPGMSADSCRHAFDRFWRADAARAVSGTGLGLPIVKSIVGAHGGSVALDTSPQTGTRVHFELPLAPQQIRN